MAISLPIVSKFDSRGVDQAETSMQQLGNVAKVTGIAMAAAFAAATVAAVEFGVQAVKSASAFEETTAAVGQVFGEGAKQLEDFAKTASTSMGQSRTQFLQAAKTFGIFGKAAGLAGQENADFATSLTGLASDLASFNDTSIDESITAIGAALRGESEPIRRFGVLLDDATLKARALEMGIYDGTGSLSQQQRVLAAYQEILAQTTTQQGDFARTADGVANGSRTLQATFENLKITIGEALLPAIEAVLPQLTAFMDEMVASPEFNDFISNLGINFGKMLEFLPTALTNMQSFGKDALPAINAFFPFLNEALGLMASLFLDIASSDPSSNTKSFAGAMRDLAQSFVDIGNGLKWVREQWDKIPQFFKLNFFEVTRVLLAAPSNGFRELEALLTNQPYYNVQKDKQGRDIIPFASGGIVTGPTRALVGEAGPEAIIPLDRFDDVVGKRGGANVTININAGLGTDGAALGEQVVNAIRRYERSSGAVFAKA